jgi:hypothetical protein
MMSRSWRAKSSERQADCADLADRGCDKREDDVEVVDHEIENHVYVERAWGEDAEPVGLEEHGPVEVDAGGCDGGVEALEMADLDDAVESCGERD